MNIIVCADFLMTRPETQDYHLKWFDILISGAFRSHKEKFNVSKFVSDYGEFSRERFFGLSNLNFDLLSTHSYFDPEIISEKSLNYLKSYIKNSLVVGYELSEETRACLDKINVTYVDVWLHPIRFMDDNFYAFHSNNKEIMNYLSEMHMDESYFYLYADKLKIQSFMGWNKFQGTLSKKIEENSALFIGQTLTDKAVCKKGKMLNVLDFKEEFSYLANKYEKVYFSRHPMLKGGDEDQINFIKGFKNVDLIDIPGYMLLCADEIKHVAAISSSLVFEAKFFQKKTSYFFRPVVPINSTNQDSGYYSIYGKLHSPKFWVDLVCAYTGEIIHAVDLNFIKSNDIYRDMLSLYYNNQVFDKVHQLYLNEQSIPISKTINNKSENKNNYLKYTKNQISFHRIIEKSNGFDTVSFDIFDTVLERIFVKPSDVIRIVGKHAEQLYGINADLFYKIRTEAKTKVPAKNEVPLFERYEVVGQDLGLDSSTWRHLYQIELNTERDVLYPKDIGVKLLNYFRKNGKRVVALSDTYFDKDFIKTILDKYSINFDEIYLSSEFNQTKEKGGLFEVLKEKEGLKVIHIGDNYKVDYEMAIKKNINSIHLVSSPEHVKDSIVSYKFSKGLLGSLSDGLIIRKISEFPAVSSNSGYSSGSVYKFGYSVVSELFYKFALFIISDAVEKGINKLYFLARDGEIVKKVVDIILDRFNIKHIRTFYLLASRRSVRVAAIKQSEDVFNEVDLIIDELNRNNYKSDLFKYLEIRLGLRVSFWQEQVISGDLDLDKALKDFNYLASYLKSNFVVEMVVDNAAKERNNYLRYGAENELNNVHESCGIVDIGHNASLQKALVDLFGLRSTKGYYFSTYSGIDDNLNKLSGHHVGVGYYRDRISVDKRSDFYIKYALVIETLFLNDKGSFICFESNGEELIPNYQDVSFENHRVNFSRELHKGIIDYAKDFSDKITELFPKTNVSDIEIYSEDICDKLQDVLKNPSLKDVQIFSGVVLENYFSGKSLRYIVPPHHDLDAACLWPEGKNLFKSNVLLSFKNDKKLKLDKEAKEKYLSTIRQKKIKNYVLYISMKIFRNFVGERKYRKFLKDPKLFVKDMKPSVTKYFLGKLI